MIKYTSRNDVIAVFDRSGMVTIASVSANIRLKFHYQALDVLRFCASARSYDEVTASMGQTAGAIFMKMIDESILVPEEKASETSFFFSRFTNPNRHRLMLSDTLRLNAYAMALKETVTPDSVVLDAGTGTGILAVIAAKLGAKKVYGIEASAYADIARKAVAENNLSAKVEILQADFSSVTLPEKADLLVTETFGSLFFNEGAIPDLIRCAEKNMKKGYMSLPSSFFLEAAPIIVPDFSTDGLLASEYGVRFSDFYAVVSEKTYVQSLSPRHIGQSARFGPYPLLSDLSHGVFELDLTVSGPVYGLCLWFTLQLTDSISLSTGPASDPYTNSWGGQTIIPYSVSSGTHRLTVRLFHPVHDKRTLAIHIKGPTDKTYII